MNKLIKMSRNVIDVQSLLNDDFESSTIGLKKTLFTHAIGEILNAQMNVVKVLTLKY